MGGCCSGIAGANEGRRHIRNSSDCLGVEGFVPRTISCFKEGVGNNIVIECHEMAIGRNGNWAHSQPRGSCKVNPIAVRINVYPSHLVLITVIDENIGLSITAFLSDTIIR